MSNNNVIKTINPATGQPLNEYQGLSKQDVENTLEKSAKSFKINKQRSFEQRSEKINTVASLLESHKADYAKVITQEMGKPFDQAKGELDICIGICKFYASKAEQLLSDRPVPIEDASNAYVAHQPIGTIFGIMPWNYPFYQVMRYSVPNLIAGNVVVLKHASNVTECGFTLQKIFEDAGFCDHEFIFLPVKSDSVESIIANPNVKGVTFTGSKSSGAKVAKAAGAHVKKSVLELGGSDPFVVLDDADLEEAVKQAVRGRFGNTGQSCTASKRIIVMNEVFDDFQEMFVEQVKNQQLGDPMDSPDLGPMAREDLRDTLHEQVQKSIKDGAKCLLGGKHADREGFFYEATVLTNVKPGMTSFDEELFGPVASLIKADSEEHALELANDTEYGLGGCVFGGDKERAERFAKKLECGMSFVNTQSQSTPEMPFGGVKNSGYGRELGDDGIYEFVNRHLIWID